MAFRSAESEELHTCCRFSSREVMKILQSHRADSCTHANILNAAELDTLNLLILWKVKVHKVFFNYFSRKTHKLLELSEP